MAREIVKKVKVKGPKGQAGFAILYDDGCIFIEWVRFSHPHIHAPWKKEGDKGAKKYSVTAMLPKKSHAAAIELVEGVIEDILAEKKVKKLKPEKLFLRDGDESEAEEYEGFVTISAREERRPPMRDRQGKPIEPGEDDDGVNIAQELFVGGHWGSVLLRPWWQDSKDWGKRVNCGLSSIQFLMKDETFGQGRLSEEDLDDIHRSHGDDDDDDSVDDDEDRPRKKKRSNDYDDDDDDRPRKKKPRRSRDDDEDDDI